MAISTVSAADNETIDVVSIENNEIILEENEPGDSPGTFTDLANEILNSTGQLDLTRDYVYSGGDSWVKSGIRVEEPILINGNGHTIDGNNQATVFTIIADYVTVTNITFSNTNSDMQSGGAICWYGYYGYLDNCKFVNSSSRIFGGSVYWSGYCGIVYACYFNNSSSSLFGGAIHWSGDEGLIKNSTFENCQALAGGGSVYWAGDDGFIDLCYFCDSSSLVEGGSILWAGDDGVVSESDIYGSSASFNGGAIYWVGNDGLVDDVGIANSIANNGGAIYWVSSNGTVSRTVFISNRAEECAGGVYFNDVDCNLINSTFKGNYAPNSSAWFSEEPLNVINVIIIKIPTVIASSDVTTNYGVPANLIATLKDADDNCLEGEQISILLDGVEYTLETDSEGQVSLAIPTDLASDTYTATIFYDGNEIYESSCATAKVIVNKFNTYLVVKDAFVEYGGDVELYATLINNDTGKGIKGANVRFIVNDQKYTVKTNSAGEAKLNISGLAPGTYDAIGSYYGNSRYNSSSGTFSVVVNKLSTSISLYYDSAAKELVATLINTETGKGISGANVVFNLNGVKTAVKTNKQGQARFAVEDSSLASAGVRYGGNSKYLYSTATAKIQEGKIPTVIFNSYNEQNDEVVATLTNAETGKGISGANVVFNFNKVKTAVKTNKQGQAIFSFAGLDPSVYYIGSSYGGNSKYAGSTTATNIVKI